MDALGDITGKEVGTVLRDISANDEMYAGDENHYFSVGKSALEAIELALLASRRSKSSIRRILDLPCGHGRVLRYLKAAFPEAEITACDLVREAVDYCASLFGAKPVYSERQPNQIKLKGGYDLIWCGSLLTHLDENGSAEFLRFFNSLLSENGVLIFTLHGISCVYAVREGYVSYNLDKFSKKKLLKKFARHGYWYTNYPGKKDYGISFIAPSWVANQFLQLPDLRLLTYTEMGWDNHQDVVSCIREPFASRVKRVL
ncbi:MAG TPA: class I SAM-dependent methyltransferase [Desulfobacteria bacterium]|nr:class I SAM-dependent methyltransferase [Desulfobacteria bacterium]